MSASQTIGVDTAGGKSSVDAKIADMEKLVSEARNLVQGTDDMFKRVGLSREKVAEIAMKTGIAALGAQMRKEEDAANAPKKVRKKKAKRARVRL